jgi:hypothetical protein
MLTYADVCGRLAQKLEELEQKRVREAEVLQGLEHLRRAAAESTQRRLQEEQATTEAQGLEHLRREHLRRELEARQQMQQMQHREAQALEARRQMQQMQHMLAEQQVLPKQNKKTGKCYCSYVW